MNGEENMNSRNKANNFSCHLANKYLKYMLVVEKYTGLSQREFIEGIIERHMYENEILVDRTDEIE